MLAGGLIAEGASPGDLPEKIIIRFYILLPPSISLYLSMLQSKMYPYYLGNGAINLVDTPKPRQQHGRPLR